MFKCDSVCCISLERLIGVLARRLVKDFYTTITAAILLELKSEANATPVSRSVVVPSGGFLTPSSDSGLGSQVVSTWKVTVQIDVNDVLRLRPEVRWTQCERIGSRLGVCLPSPGKRDASRATVASRCVV